MAPVRRDEPMAVAHPEWIRHDGRKACIPRPDGLCVALEGDGSGQAPWRCLAYDIRPRACSDLAPGSLACLVARRRTGLSR
jgi:Fe-S-cluster containining protein